MRLWALFHFFLPFYLLLFRAVKKHVAPLTAVAATLLLVHIVSIYWMVMPAWHPSGPKISWLDFTAPIGVGGLWVAVFLANLKSAPLLLQHDQACNLPLSMSAKPERSLLFP